MRRLELNDNTQYSCLASAIAILGAGGTVVVPTDTVYGLAGYVKNPKAIEAIFAIKGRPANNPLPILVNSIEEIEKVAFVPDDQVKKFLDRIWPGKITCVLPARGWLPKEILGVPKSGLEARPRGLTIGVRVPKYHFLNKLLEAFKEPLSGTSANVSGRGPYTKIEDLISDFEKLPMRPDLIIDAGDLPDSKPSTLIDVTCSPPEIMREGAVSRRELESLYY